MMPKAGGGYVYLREAFGERVAYMSGMSTFIIGSSGSIAGLAIALPQALTSIFPMTELQCKLFAVLMVVLLTAVNYRGVKFGAAIQNVFMIGKLIPWCSSSSAASQWVSRPPTSPQCLPAVLPSARSSPW